MEWTIFTFLFISGGRPEASKRNLNFQTATWHHLKHLQIKDFFSQSIIICKFDPNCYHVIARVVAAAEDLVLGFSFSCCHKLYKPLLNGCVMTYWLPATSRQAFVCFCPLHSRQWRLVQTSKPIDINFCINLNRKRNVSQLGDWNINSTKGCPQLSNKSWPVDGDVMGDSLLWHLQATFMEAGNLQWLSQ